MDPERISITIDLQIDNAPADPAWREAILDWIIDYCEDVGALVGGGMGPAKEPEEDDDGHET